MGKKYEYNFLYSRCSPPLDRLNEMASQGWELCAASDPYWIIKREIESEADEKEKDGNNVCTEKIEKI